MLLCAITSANAQKNLDNTWLLGYAPNDSLKKFGGTQISFNTTPVTFNFFNIPFSLLANSAISDTKGQLLFYTNGCEVMNNNHTLIKNGDSINAGFIFNSWCEELGYPLHQGVLILPWPDKVSRYVILHYRNSDSGDFDISDLLYTVVDISTNNNNGSVTAKNKMIYEHFNFADNLTAIRHGNGRDWWIIAPKRHSNRYFKFLLSPEGFAGPYIQDFGKKWTNIQGGSQACFSPDGAKYIRMAPFDTGCQIGDFDRCSGIISNPVNLSFPKDTIYSNGCAVSPSNRFLYISAYEKVYQFDLQAPDISSSRVLLGKYDGSMAPFATRFFQSMLAPDGKIYMTSPNGVWVMHVVHNPDEKGLACNFEQHGIELPTHILFPIPNFPHYRLFDLPGSSCDTLGIDGTVSAAEPAAVRAGPLRIFPNPAGAGEPVRIEAGELFGVNDRLYVFNALGQLWRELALPQGKSHLVLPAGEIPSGVYFFQLLREKGQEQVGRLVIVRKRACF